MELGSVNSNGEITNFINDWKNRINLRIEERNVKKNIL